jgi:hypothetical protein
MTETENQSKKLFWRPIALNRSTRSKAGMPLYSADVSRVSGSRGDRIQIYLRTNCCHPDRADGIRIMAYGDEPPSDFVGEVLVSLRLSADDRERYANSRAMRYRSWGDVVSDVYLPRSFVPNEPSEIWLTIEPVRLIGRSLRGGQR